MSENQTTEQIKADAINEFVCVIIGAYESGFITQNYLTLHQLHNLTRAHIRSEFNIDLPNIVEQWGASTAKACGNDLSDFN